MNFKALILALLAIISATYAMEKPVAPQIIDIQGAPFNLSPELSQALLKCTNLKAREDFSGTLDFTGLDSKTRPYLTKDKITLLAFLIISPRSIERAELAPRIKQLDFFELAHYLGAPDNILYLLANELWPLMQDQKEDATDVKAYKKYIRQLAKPHFASPRHLLNYLKTKTSYNTLDICRWDCDPITVELSFNVLQKFYKEEKDNGWYRYKDSFWCINYPFCSLEGITELISYLKFSGTSCSLQIKLKNHYLETFSCDLAPYIETLDLTDNNIKELSGQQLKYTNRPPRRIILDGNPISSINDSFFEALRNIRSRWFVDRYDANRKQYQDDIGCFISLGRTALTNNQKKLISTKFNNAAKTLPERLFNRTAFDVGIALTGAVVGGVASYYALDYIKAKAPIVMTGLFFTPLPLLLAGDEKYQEKLGPAALGIAMQIAIAYQDLKGANNLAHAGGVFVGGTIGLGVGVVSSYLAALGLAKCTHPKITFDRNKDIFDYDRDLLWNRNSAYSNPFRNYALKF